MAKKKYKFKRTDFKKYSKLGVRRKKKQKYRKGKGIDNKMRLKIKGHLRKVESGFKSKKKTRNLVKKMSPVIIHNLEDLKKITKSEIGIIAKVGDKKRKEIAQYAIQHDIKLFLNPREILNKIEERLKKSKEKGAKRKARKIEKDKKAQKEAEKKAKKEAKEEAKAIKGEEEKEKADNAQKPSSSKEADTDKPKKDINEDKQDNKKQIQTNNYGRGK